MEEFHILFTCLTAKTLSQVFPLDVFAMPTGHEMPASNVETLFAEASALFGNGTPDKTEMYAFYVPEPA